MEFKRIPGKPAEEKPVIEKPVTEKPVIEKSAAEKTVAEKPAAVVEEKPAAEMQRQTSREDIAAREQIAKLQAENHEQKSRLAVMEEKAAGLAAEVLRLKEKLKQYFLVGLAIGIIGTVLAVLMINMLKQNANKTDPVSTEQIVAAAEDSEACGSYEIYALEGVL